MFQHVQAMLMSRDVSMTSRLAVYPSTRSAQVLSQPLTLGHFIFRFNLSFKPKLKPKFGLKPKLMRKIKWRQSSV